MIAGIGVDLTTLSRISQVHDRFGERFARRILNDNELDQYLAHQYPARMLAKRFAIKEAAVKALGTGERDGVLLKDFWIHHDELGKPVLEVSGAAARRCQAIGIDCHHVSVTDEGDKIAAFVILEKS